MAARRLDRGADVDHTQRRVGRGLDEDQAQIGGARHGRLEGGAVAGHRRDRQDAEWLQDGVDQVLRAAVERQGLHEAPARPAERQEDGRDRRHARVEDGGRGRPALERHDLVLQDLGVRVRQAGVDQVDALVGVGPRLPEGDGEGALGRLGAVEDVGGRAEHGGPGRSEGQARVEAAGQGGGRGPDDVGGFAFLHGRASARGACGRAADLDYNDADRKSSSRGSA